MFKFIKYFFYVAYHWNLNIARVLLLQEIRGEKKYGINTSGADELKNMEKRGIDISHATIYMPVSYGIIGEVFDHLKKPDSVVVPFRHFLDIGCGKGRAMCVAAAHGCQQVTGIDFSPELCTSANRNLALTKKHMPGLEYRVINNDAFYFEIPDGVDCIFLFNPFDEVIMHGVVDNIIRYTRKNQRKVTVIYVNPIHKDLFTGKGFPETYHSKKMKYLEVSVLEN